MAVYQTKFMKSIIELMGGAEISLYLVFGEEFYLREGEKERDRKREGVKVEWNYKKELRGY